MFDRVPDLLLVVALGQWRPTVRGPFLPRLAFSSNVVAKGSPKWGP